METVQEWLLVGAAVHHALFAGFHAGFWKLFSWRTDLPQLSRVNRGILQVLNLCLIYVFAAAAGLLFAFRAECTSTAAGRAVLLVIACFWLLRLIEQFVFFSRRHRVSWLLAGLFALGAALHALPVLLARSA